MDTLYPIFYGTRLVTFDVIEATFKPHMHPEAWRRGANFLLHHGGKFGIGGGRRLVQPIAPGFAPPGQTFHMDQDFPSGRYYTAWDTVVVNPGYPHRAPLWSEVPVQGTQQAIDYGFHMNVGIPYKPDSESWHGQPCELDGYTAWVNAGRPDLRANYPIVISAPRPPVPQPPVPPALPPVTSGVYVNFASRELVEGSVGPDVKFYQRQMNELSGQGLLLDGHYGPKTTQAVKNWQGFFKQTSDGKPLGTDGKLGPNTQQSIIEVSLAAS
jgi:Putative peptidoglycan binding domain